MINRDQLPSAGFVSARALQQYVSAIAITVGQPDVKNGNLVNFLSLENASPAFFANPPQLKHMPADTTEHSKIVIVMSAPCCNSKTGYILVYSWQQAFLLVQHMANQEVQITVI